MIKPSFFLNEDLATLPYEARLLFIGLWCVADREGRLEDRPRRLKAELFPYDDIDLDPLLWKLAELGFIVRYEAQGKRYIQIANFTKHQRLHPNEAPSEIPPPPEPALLEGSEPGQEASKNGQTLQTDACTTDSHHGNTYSHLGDTDDAPCDNVDAPRCDVLTTMVVPARSCITSTSCTSTTSTSSSQMEAGALSRAAAAADTDVPLRQRTSCRVKDERSETLVDATDVERDVVACIRAVPGMQNVPDAEVLEHYRAVVRIRGPCSDATERLEAMRFRDYWSERRKGRNDRWRGWKNAVTNWFSRTKEVRHAVDSRGARTDRAAGGGGARALPPGPAVDYDRYARYVRAD
jgi:hypothetical protein